jgi:hypothetical protein
VAKRTTMPRRSRTTGTPARKRRAPRQPVRAASKTVPAGSKKARAASRRKPKRSLVVARTGGVTISEVEELDALRRELERTAGRSAMRWNADPEDVQRSVAQLVLTLVEFIRKLLERQAIRRMDAGTLTDQQTEDIGRALMKLEETIIDMAGRFGLSPDDLNLDLGPVGKLM